MDWVRDIGIAFPGLLSAGLLVLLLGCGAKNEVKSSTAQLAHIRSEVRIASMDGQQYSEPLYDASLEPGPHVLIIWYPTVLASYRCTFEVDLQAGQSYEIIERSDRFPVFLNRMEEDILFSLLSRRVKRFPPRECTKIKRTDEH